MKLEWVSCSRCGGDLPLVEEDNDHATLPRLKKGGDCPGHRWGSMCGAYDGWSRERLTRYLARKGVGLGT